MTVEDEWSVVIKNSAKSDLKKLKQSHLRQSSEEMFKQLKKVPYAPNQSMEKLQLPVANKYSRRINSQHRVVYKVDEEHRRVEIYSAWTHYEK